MWATRTLVQLLLALLVLSTTALASPATPGGPALFARRSHDAHVCTFDDKGGMAIPQTNVARFARGLTPLKYKNLFTPTRARRADPSALPSCVSFTLGFCAILA